MKTTTFLAAMWAGLMIAGLAAAAPPDRAAYNLGAYTHRPARVYVQRYEAPLIVRAPVAAPTPAVVADANANAEARRTFSVEPQSPVQAPAASNARRAYSYEPADVAAPMRTYQRTTRARTPIYLLPKTDSRRFGG